MLFLHLIEGSWFALNLSSVCTQHVWKRYTLLFLLLLLLLLLVVVVTRSLLEPGAYQVAWISQSIRPQEPPLCSPWCWVVGVYCPPEILHGCSACKFSSSYLCRKYFTHWAISFSQSINAFFLLLSFFYVRTMKTMEVPPPVVRIIASLSLSQSPKFCCFCIQKINRFVH